MGNPLERQEHLQNLLTAKRVMSFYQLLEVVNCAEITLRRDLKKIGAITSYTHQGRYITLKRIPVFNDIGIWFYRDIGFTKYQSSLELIVELVNSSSEGLSREQIQETIKIQTCQQIQVLMMREKLNRVKIGSKYVYLPKELATNKRKRLQILNANTVEEHYDSRVKISDLVALLKIALIEGRITTDSKSIKRLTEKYSLKLPVKKIERLLLKYQLAEKKTR